MTRLLSALLLLVVSAAPAWADRTINGPIRVGPGVGGTGAAINVQNTFVATQYGACTWDGTHDVGPCVNAAIAAAVAGGGGTVVIPAGSYGLATTISQTDSKGVMVEGAGSPGNYLVCSTELLWIGAGGGTMLSYANPAHNIVGPGLSGICLNGNDTAGTGIYQRSNAHGRFLYNSVRNVTSVAWDLRSQNFANGGQHHNIYKGNNITLISAAAINANGIVYGPVDGNDSYVEVWEQTAIQYQNGTGIICQGVDSSIMRDVDVLPANGGTGTSLHLLGSPVSLGECRHSRFETSGGFGRNSTTRPVADTDVSPSRNNYVLQNPDSGAVITLVVGDATVTSQTFRGDTQTNASISQLVSGVWKVGYTDVTGDIFTVFRKNQTSSSLNTIALSFLNDSDLEKQFAAITARLDSNVTGSEQGTLVVRASDAGTMADIVRFRGNGAIEMGAGTFGHGAGPGTLLPNDAAYGAMDSGGDPRSLLKLDPTDTTILSGPVNLSFVENHGSSTIGTSNGAGNFAWSHPVILKNYTVATLPTCDASIKHSIASVDDATAPVYNAALVGGGGSIIPVFCNGTAWTAH